MEEKENALTDADHWKDFWGDHSLKKITNAHFSKYYKRYLPSNIYKTGSCIEIGAFPGNNLIFAAKQFGLKPVALDFVDDRGYVAANMQFNGINDFEIINADFAKWATSNSYDVVLSHGFIEHFSNYSEIIEKHISLLKEGGLMFLSVPSFTTPFQMIARKIFYKKAFLEKVLASHNTEIMNKKKLNEEILKHASEIDILFIDYIDGMQLSLPTDNLRPLLNIPLLFLRIFLKILSFTNISSSFFSPQLLAVVIKRKTALKQKEN